MQRVLTISLALVFALASGVACASGDIAAGKQKSAVCAACHGPDGNATADGQYPRLAGQYADYLVQALHEYRSGDREHPAIGIHRNNAIMQGMAAPLTEQDIDNLAAYYASLPGKLSDLKGKVQGSD
ncbi:MAG: cytochrome c [Proteobacteria bacterium]|nr:cytochrome c [Pseudomonadota bacterium]